MITLTLKVVGGEVEAQEIPLRLPAVLGRGHDVAVNLTHPLVSRRHCEIREADGKVVVRDLASLNGTYVGSERVEEGLLNDGDLLTIGTVTFRAIYSTPEDQPISSAAQPAQHIICSLDGGEDVDQSKVETVRYDGAQPRPAPHRVTDNVPDRLAAPKPSAPLAPDNLSEDEGATRLDSVAADPASGAS